VPFGIGAIASEEDANSLQCSAAGAAALMAGAEQGG